MNGNEQIAHPSRCRNVAFALITLERPLERDRGLFRLAGEREHLGEVAERVALVVEPVRFFDDRNGFSGQCLRLDVSAAVGFDERLNLPQERLPQRVLSNAELARDLSPTFGLLMPADRAQLAPQHRCEAREEEALAALLEQLADPLEVTGGRFV